MHFPKFFCLRNPENTRWILGWMTGIDNDLICIKPNVQNRVMEHYALSPVCSSWLLAFFAFLAKRFLLVFDQNINGLER